MHSPTAQAPEKNTGAEYDSLGLFSEEIYNKLGLKGTDEDDTILDAVLIDSRDFSPTEYLRRVHGQTSFENLKKGMIYLSEIISQEETLLKDILKSNFDRFVNAKGTIDSKPIVFVKPFHECFIHRCL